MPAHAIRSLPPQRAYRHNAGALPLTEQELAGIRDPKDRLAAQDARRQRQNEARATLLQGVGALLVFTSAGLGAYFTWRQFRHNREQLEATREQLEVARQGQVTEQFIRAIDQLGSDQLDIRLGGIYALERIARDSEADRATIAEILTAYIRTHSPWPPTQPGQYKPDWPLEQQPDLRTRAPDVQAALTVLGRGRFASLAELDLGTADLRKGDLGDAHLERVDLAGARLEGADLGDARLEGADLGDAHLEQANLFGAYLNRADLINAHLKGADLSFADLRGADLDGADLEGANAIGTRWSEGFDWRAAGAIRVDRSEVPVADSGGKPDGAGSAAPAEAGVDPSVGVSPEPHTAGLPSPPSAS